MANTGTDGKSQEIQDIKDFILVVSEDYESRLLLKTLLELWKYRTIESPTVGGAENLSGFFPPQMILLDTNSSFGQALENICAIRQNDLFANLPLIVLSGYSQSHFRDLALTNGADVYLTKPLNFARMENIMSELITSRSVM